MRTEDLLDRLVRDLRPVRPLTSTSIRLLGWLAVALPTLAFWTMLFGIRPDIEQRLADPRFLIETMAATATGICAAIAAIDSTVPGAPRWRALLPLPPLVLWLLSLGEGCLRILWEPTGTLLEAQWQCVSGIVLVSAIPGLALLFVLRRGVLLTSGITFCLGALSVSALAAAAMRLFHPVDASLLVLIWQFGTVVALSALAAIAGRRLRPFTIR
jgi:hypothetical protein